MKDYTCVLCVIILISCGCHDTHPSNTTTMTQPYSHGSKSPFTTTRATSRPSLHDFALTSALSLAQVERDIGRPDSSWGSGTTWFVYNLSDGRQLQLHFAEPFDHLDEADLVDVGPAGKEVKRTQVFPPTR